MTKRRPTSKGCPWSLRRDTTERNKAELSPWMLSGAASALAGCPRTARRKATRNAGANPYVRDGAMRVPAAKQRALPSPWPPLSARTRLVLQINKEARASEYSPHGRTTLTGVLSHPPGWRSGASDGCTSTD